MIWQLEDYYKSYKSSGLKKSFFFLVQRKNSRIFMNYLILLYFLLSLFACSITKPTNQLPEETAMNNWSSSLKEMKKETLDQACDDEMRLFYEKEIERQSKHLNPA